MTNVRKTAFCGYRSLNVNQRINLRSHYQGSAYRREYFGDAPLMSVWGIIGAMEFAFVWGWYWCD